MFENYEARIDKVNTLLNKYGIKDIEEAKSICDSYELDVYNLVKGIQPICFEDVYCIYIVSVLHPDCIKHQQKKRTSFQRFAFDFISAGVLVL